jgi:predicted nucleic acid-binding protein
MFAVSDTTPLRYLIAIGHERLFELLFDKVVIPGAVYDELTDARTPEIVSRYILSAPSWLEVRTLREVEEAAFPVLLHRGERQAILLAESLRPDVLLLDEKRARRLTLSRNIPLLGTLGLLERADVLSLVADFPGTLETLKTSGFFLAQPLQRQLLQRHSRRK